MDFITIPIKKHKIEWKISRKISLKIKGYQMNKKGVIMYSYTCMTCIVFLYMFVLFECSVLDL